MDEGHPIHYMAVPRGTAVYASDEVEVGKVVEMLDNHRENIFDGVVFRGSDGTTRFADAPEVARTAERAVILTIDSDAARELGPPPKPGRGAGRVKRIFGR